MAAITKQKQHLDLDGKAIIDAKLINCTVDGKKLEDGLGGGGGADSYFDVEGAIPTTMSELRRLANDGELEAGRCYRVTDYRFITNKGFTASAGHQFDIIVKATSEDWIPYKAMAVPHVFEEDELRGFTLKIWEDFSEPPTEDIFVKRIEDSDIELDGIQYYAWLGDGIYFLTKTLNVVPDESPAENNTDLYMFMSDMMIAVPLSECGLAYMITGVEKASEYFANTDFSKWELEYDAGAWGNYDWVSSYDGCGVIRYMKDEFGNEAPYDFKNMLFYIDESYSEYTFPNPTTDTDPDAGPDGAGDASMTGNYVAQRISEDWTRLGAGNFYLQVYDWELTRSLKNINLKRANAIKDMGLAHKIVFVTEKGQYPVLCVSEYEVTIYYAPQEKFLQVGVVEPM